MLSLVVAAGIISRLIAGAALTPWLALPIIAGGTKILADIALLARGVTGRFLYFEDYLRETLFFLLLASISGIVITAVQHYVGGTVWQPAVAAGLVYVWQK